MTPSSKPLAGPFKIKKAMNLFAGEPQFHGVAVREIDTEGGGPADYMLFVQGKACGIIEAKREGTSLGTVAEQSGSHAIFGTKYTKRWADEDQPRPFLYEATNHENRFRDERNPSSCSRKVFHYHQSKTLRNQLEEGTTPREIRHTPDIQIKTFDFCIVDECHRSVFNLWRQVLEYFDAFLIGVTATPTNKTIGFLNQNLVSEYTHEDAVIDRVNVGYDIYRIRTRKIEEGDNNTEAGNTVSICDRLTKEGRLETLDHRKEYHGKQLDRSVIASNQIRTIIQTFHDRVFQYLFLARIGDWLPQNLIFAKDEDHADRKVDSQPRKQRHLSYAQLQDLVDDIEQPPYNIAPSDVWKAYEKLEKLKAKGALPQRKTAGATEGDSLRLGGDQGIRALSRVGQPTLRCLAATAAQRFQRRATAMV
ncbi:DEAD/DEAH box helicase family protein [Marinobacter guineae]|uniref:DEAD/DEAH box helicase family protein n=1 Tax=Marinobacter guineae TaxID=432303 RepID=UPI001B80DC74|nr:DEAD/DEAH box helicase family protein [Marinobacter guineae]